MNTKKKSNKPVNFEIPIVFNVKASSFEEAQQRTLKYTLLDENGKEVDWVIPDNEMDEAGQRVIYLHPENQPNFPPQNNNP